MAKLISSKENDTPPTMARARLRFGNFLRKGLDNIPTGWYVPRQMMTTPASVAGPGHESKTRILDAALQVIRAKGYSATRIEDVCEAAGLTKGSFFHHFDSKEELAIAAADYWTEVPSALFAQAPYHAPTDPLHRIVAHVDFRKSLRRGELADFTCLVGTMMQEVYDTHPAIRQACERSITGHARTLVPEIEAAIERYGIDPEWTAESLALFTQAALQGAFILAKARHSADPAADAIDHLRRYISLLFGQRRNAREMP
jgi:TetR/AcrR family transcriptional regulator, transcriptional repressor for nem operon